MLLTTGCRCPLDVKMRKIGMSMRNVVLSMFITLDGFIAGPNGEFDAFDPSEEELAFGNEFFQTVDGFLFGRVIYEGFVSYWDALDPADDSLTPANREFARIFRKTTRVVFSRTLEKVDDDAILIKDNIATEVAKLKHQPGRDLALVCGPALLATFVGLGLIDEYRLMVLPTALGRGKALFGDLQEGLKLKLVATQAFTSGTVLHHYQSVDRP
jgi:dihydrofolate reductase